MRRLVLRCSTALLVLALESAAFAQAPAAASSYGEARRAFQEERYRDAALGFEAVDRAQPDAVALYTAGQAWELAADPARAADAYAQALARTGLDSNQAARARERLAALGAALGAADVTGREGTRVELDDHAAWQVPVRLHGTPGEHVVRITHSDGGVERRALVFTAGSVLSVDAAPAPAAALPPAAPAPALPPPVLPEPRKNPVREAPSSARSPLWVGAGIAGLGAGIGALAGGLVLSLAAHDADETAENAPSASAEDHADTTEEQAVGMLVVGGVLTAAGTGILIWQATQPADAARGLKLRLARDRLLLEGKF